MRIIILVIHYKRITKMGFLLLALFVFFMYMLPGIVATYYSTSNHASVMIINIFFGWTIVGWIISLLLACKSLSGKELAKTFFFVVCFAIMTTATVAIDVNNAASTI